MTNPGRVKKAADRQKAGYSTRADVDVSAAGTQSSEPAKIWGPAAVAQQVAQDSNVESGRCARRVWRRPSRPAEQAFVEGASGADPLATAERALAGGRGADSPAPAEPATVEVAQGTNSRAPIMDAAKSTNPCATQERASVEDVQGGPQSLYSSAASVLSRASRKPLRNCISQLVTTSVDTARLRSDICYYPGMLGDADDATVCDSLMYELDFRSCWLNTGMKFNRNICLGTDEVVARSPTYSMVIKKLAAAFDVEVVRSLANLYRSGDDWCNLHSDQYHQDSGKSFPIDLTVGATFGAERELVFVEKADPNKTIHVPQRNGDVFAFSERVNRAWRHKVPKADSSVGPRVSVIVWCTKSKSDTEWSCPGDDTPSLGTFPHMLYHDPSSRHKEWHGEAWRGRSWHGSDWHGSDWHGRHNPRNGQSSGSEVTAAEWSRSARTHGKW
eukprot:gnl/TRDRNA2_/TRDRNA2_81515_c0_seq1.p1 gnl/TRDRNA2_/TRDRNA2_81515_c0~~gnl/TRDRNA2_/TRDRNA2_81515_c0_seq1.p1  ORF type:complete len:444 (+),score=67.97 gnl/TRDRNA2_/TRDRNA2_81515_c0_seq1:97-1428(+)